MDELGYVGNEQARALRLGRTRTIGLLFDLLSSLPMPFWLDVIAGAEERAYAAGYSLVMCDSSGSADKEAEYLSLLLGQRVAGIIYTSPQCRSDAQLACARLVESDTPVVVISSEPHDLPYDHVRTDDKRAGYVAVRHLLDVRRHRLAMVAATAGAMEQVFAPWSAINDRLEGAAYALRDTGLSPADIPVYVASNTADGGRAVGQAILSKGTPLPDGLFVTTDIMALGLLETLRSAGVRIPEDMAVVGHDDLFTSSISVPALTTVAPPRRKMGQECVDLLLRPRDGRRTSRVHMLDADLVVRESTVGTAVALRGDRRTPISHVEAWTMWRNQSPVTRPFGGDAGVRVTVDTLDRMTEASYVAVPAT